MRTVDLRQKKLRIALMSLLFILIFSSACTEATVVLEESPTAEETKIIQPTETLRPFPTSTQANTPIPDPTEGISLPPEDLDGVSLHFVHPWGGRADDLLVEIATQFSLSNPWNIWVDVEGFGSEAALMASLESSLEVGEIPGLIAIQPYQLTGVEDKILTIDLEPYFNDSEWGFDESAAGDIHQIFLDQFRLGESLVALPVAPRATVLFYNQTWGNELGFEGAPANAEAFQSQSCEATFANQADVNEANDGTGGYPRNVDPNVLASWYAAFGGELPDQAMPQFNSETGREAFGFLKSMDEKGCIWINRKPDPYIYFANRYALFYAGTLDHIPAQLAWMDVAGNEDQWKVMGFPGSSGETMVIDGPGLMVSADSPENQMAAWLFAQHLLSPEIQAKLVQQLFTLPVRRSAVDELDDFSDQYPQWAQGLALVDDAQTLPITENWAVAQWVLQDGILRLFNLPEGDVSTILGEVDAMIGDME